MFYMCFFFYSGCSIETSNMKSPQVKILTSNLRMDQITRAMKSNTIKQTFFQSYLVCQCQFSRRPIIGLCKWINRCTKYCEIHRCLKSWWVKFCFVFWALISLLNGVEFWKTVLTKVVELIKEISRRYQLCWTCQPSKMQFPSAIFASHLMHFFHQIYVRFQNADTKIKKISANKVQTGEKGNNLAVLCVLRTVYWLFACAQPAAWMGNGFRYCGAQFLY